MRDIDYTDPHEFFENEDTPRRVKPKRWKNCLICTKGSLELIVATSAYTYLVWGDEGEFVNGDRWVFNDKHHDFEPLLVDVNTARIMVQFLNHTFENESTKEKVLKMFENRMWFAKLAEIGWANASFGGVK